MTFMHLNRTPHPNEVWMHYPIDSCFVWLPNYPFAIQQHRVHPLVMFRWAWRDCANRPISGGLLFCPHSSIGPLDRWPWVVTWISPIYSIAHFTRFMVIFHRCLLFSNAALLSVHLMNIDKLVGSSRYWIFVRIFFLDRIHSCKHDSIRLPHLNVASLNDVALSTASHTQLGNDPKKRPRIQASYFWK